MAAIVGEGVATNEELEQAREAVLEFTADPTNLLGSPQVIQVWARVPVNA